MADIAQNLITYLLTNSSISTAVGGNRICQTHVPQEFTGDCIWFGRNDVADNDCLDAQAGDDPFEHYFDLECISATEDGALALAALVKGRFPYRGTMGTQNVQGAFCEGQEDDYESRAIDSDSGLFYCAMKLTLAPTN